MVACFLPGLMIRKREPQGKECCLRFSAALCVSAISALKAFAISARKLSRGSGIQEGVGQGILGPQHFVETEGFGTRKTASLVASRHYAKSLALIVAYLNAEAAETQRRRGPQREFPKDPVVVLARRRIADLLI